MSKNFVHSRGEQKIYVPLETTQNEVTQPKSIGQNKNFEQKTKQKKTNKLKASKIKNSRNNSKH